jgi:hypothetical protein
VCRVIFVGRPYTTGVRLGTAWQACGKHNHASLGGCLNFESHSGQWPLAAYALEVDIEDHIVGRLQHCRYVLTQGPLDHIAKRRCSVGPLEEAEPNTDAGRSCLKLGYLYGIFGAICHAIRWRRWTPEDVDGTMA